MYENGAHNKVYDEEITNDVREIVDVPVDRIRPNPYQPRKSFSRAALLELCESIKEYGVLQPINVRKLSCGTYELISGERRLKASQMAGLKKIPVIVSEITDNDSAIIALIENLQREDLNFMEEAEGYYSLLTEHGMTQDDLARKVGKSQSTVANKIRLLKLSPLIKKIISDNELTERHARALLKIPDEQLQLKVLKIVCDEGFNVQKTEDYISEEILKYPEILSSKPADKTEPTTKEQLGKMKLVVKDIKIFVNTIKETIMMLKRTGIEAKAAQFDRGEYLEFIIRIPKAENGLLAKKI
ncbi:MAG: nucleoid occlusion protein [Clostridiales bacterium]|jgi:ParB family chromosome partitioning protein|nr:nucleoid occlusion protein [Clostridiales bacterium]